MKIMILTMGTRGDTQPFISLAVWLKNKGHDVTLGARPDFADLVKEYGIRFAALGKSYKSFIMDSTKGFEKGNFFQIAVQGVKQQKLMLGSLGEDAYQAAIGSDAIIYKHSWLGGYSIAEKLNIPCAAVMLFPLTPTKEFPCYMIGQGKKRSPLMNAFFWWASVQLITWQYQRSYDNKLRRKTLRIKPLPFFGPYKRQVKEAMPVFYAYSPLVQPKPADWPECIHVTGIWKSLPPENWKPPEDLLAFLASGPAPVYIGFGSMPSNAQRTLAIVLKALEISNMRAVLLSGWADIGGTGKLPPTVLCVKDIPHHWLFPQMAAVVHHGGAGTTAAGLLSGVPSIITPSSIDQYSWARQVHALGAGPASIPFKSLTGELLAGAIQETLSNETMRQKAKELSAILAKENGIEKTIEIFEKYYRRKKQIGS